MKKVRNGILLAFIMLALIAIPVLAQSYTASITVTETDGEDYTQLPIIASINSQFLADNNYITASGLDTRVLEVTDVLPHMLASDRLLFASDINANTQTIFTYTLGNSLLNAFYIIVGYSGYVTVADDDSIELGDNFEVELQGFVDTSEGADKNLVFKDLAFKVWVSGEKEISAAIYKDGGWTACVVTATNIITNTHFIEVTADVQNLRLYINGNLEDTEVLGGTISVPENTNGWSFATNGSMLYVEFLKIWVD